jgi:hypothetical protein
MVSHSVYLLIALVAISMILVAFSSLRDNIEKVSVVSNLNLIADTVKLDILKLYSSSEESGKIEIPLQSELGGKPFIVKLSQGQVVVELDDFQVKKEVLINANLNGMANLPAYLVLSNIGGEKTINLVAS